MSIMRKKAISLAIKSTEETGLFKGLGSVFGNVDSYGDIVVRGAFEKSLATHRKAGTLPALLWQHDTHQPIGIYKSMAEVDEGLDLEGQFALEIEKGRDAHVLTKMKALRGLSIGFTVPKGGMEYDDEKGVTLLKEIDLWEVSVVTFPANALANITDVRSALRDGNMPSERDFEAILRDAGFSRTLAKACVAQGYREVLREAESAEEFDVEGIVSSLKNLATVFRS
jgi:HK97 family phage prohead protease